MTTVKTKSIYLLITIFCIAVFCTVLKGCASIDSAQIESESSIDCADVQISLTDILNSAIGAFLGFGTSLFLEQVLTSSRKRKSIDNIVSELISIRDGIREDILKSINLSAMRTDCNLVSTDIDMMLIDTKIRQMAYVIYAPIWETVLQTGDILEFKNKSYFEDLILLYTKIYKLKTLIDSYYKTISQEKNKLAEILTECVEIDEIFTNKEKYHIANLVKDVTKE